MRVHSRECIVYESPWKQGEWCICGSLRFRKRREPLAAPTVDISHVLYVRILLHAIHMACICWNQYGRVDGAIGERILQVLICRLVVILSPASQHVH